MRFSFGLFLAAVCLFCGTLVYAETEMEDGVTMNKVKREDVLRFVERQKIKLGRVEETLTKIIKMKELPQRGTKYNKKQLRHVRNIAQKMVGKLSYMIDIVEPLLRMSKKIITTPFFEGKGYTVSTDSIIALEKKVKKIKAEGKQSSKGCLCWTFFF